MKKVIIVLCIISIGTIFPGGDGRQIPDGLFVNKQVGKQVRNPLFALITNVPSTRPTEGALIAAVISSVAPANPANSANT